MYSLSKINILNIINYCDFFQQKCVLMGGHLASVHSDGEYDFLKNLVLAEMKSSVLTWLGATDAAQVCDTKTSFQRI